MNPTREKERWMGKLVNLQEKKMCGGRENDSFQIFTKMVFSEHFKEKMVFFVIFSIFFV